MRMTHICPLLIDAMLGRDAHTQDSKLRSRRTPVQQGTTEHLRAAGGLWKRGLVALAAQMDLQSTMRAGICR